MQMNKYNFKKRLIPIIGFTICVICFMALFLSRHLQESETVAVKPGREMIDGLKSWHMKGSYNDDVIESFVFSSKHNPSLPFDIKGYFVEDIVYCFLPESINKKATLSVSAFSDNTILCNGTEIKNNVQIDLQADNRIETDGRVYTVKPVYTKLPYISFETMDNNLVYPGGGYVPAIGRMWEKDSVEILSQVFQVRVRGNTTAECPKLSYKIKTENNFELYGLNKADEWTLLANFFDPSMLRNYTAYSMSDMLGMEYVPQQEYVELFLNGEYQGVYAFTTQIGIHSGNIDLKMMDNSLDGSYLLEMDFRTAGTEYQLDSLFDITVVIKEPSNFSTEQKNKIQQDLTRFEKAILSEDFTADGIHYSELIDVKSFADFYLVNEIMGNHEARSGLSVYIYKNSEGKLAMGPVWDMDFAAGNNSDEKFRKAEGIPLSECHWYQRLLSDPVFCKIVKEEYAKLASAEDKLHDRFVKHIDEISQAANNNFIVTYIGVNSYSNFPSDDPFVKEVTDLWDWIHTKFDWLNNNLDNIWSRI